MTGWGYWSWPPRGNWASTLQRRLRKGMSERQEIPQDYHALWFKSLQNHNNPIQARLLMAQSLQEWRFVLPHKERKEPMSSSDADAGWRQRIDGERRQLWIPTTTMGLVAKMRAAIFRVLNMCVCWLSVCECVEVCVWIKQLFLFLPPLFPFPITHVVLTLYHSTQVLLTLHHSI